MIMNKPRTNVHFRLYSTILFAVLACLAVTPSSSAGDKSVKEKQLKTLLHKIDKLKKTIDVKEDSKSRYIKQLKTIERSVGKVNLKIRKIDDQIKTSRLKKPNLRHCARPAWNINAGLAVKMSTSHSRFTRRLPWVARKRSSCCSHSRNPRPCNATLSTTSIFPMRAWR